MFDDISDGSPKAKFAPKENHQPPVFKPPEFNTRVSLLGSGIAECIKVITISSIQQVLP
jgi:hypothetical protein